MLSTSETFHLWYTRTAALLRLAQISPEAPLVIDAAVATLCAKCPSLAGEGGGASSLSTAENAARMLSAVLAVEAVGPWEWAQGSGSQGFLR